MHKADTVMAYLVILRGIMFYSAVVLLALGIDLGAFLFALYVSLSPLIVLIVFRAIERSREVMGELGREAVVYMKRGARDMSAWNDFLTSTDKFTGVSPPSEREFWTLVVLLTLLQIPPFNNVFAALYLNRERRYLDRFLSEFSKMGISPQPTKWNPALIYVLSVVTAGISVPLSAKKFLDYLEGLRGYLTASLNGLSQGQGPPPHPP